MMSDASFRKCMDCGRAIDLDERRCGHCRSVHAG